MTKFWTYVYIDYDLLSDDLNSAEGIMPVLMWATKEEAIAAAEADHKGRCEDEDYAPLEWKQGFPFYDSIAALPEDSTQIIVYPITLQEKS